MSQSSHFLHCSSLLHAALPATVRRRGSAMETEIQGEEKKERRLCLLRSPGAEALSKFQNLQEDVLIEILCRLPVKTLLQLKSVCRRWNEIISSGNPWLVSTHLKNHTNNPASDASAALIYNVRSFYGRGFTIMQLYPDGDASQVRYLEPPLRVIQERSLYMEIISGPCNGIFLLGIYTGYVYSLWNPATGSLKELPVVTQIGRDTVRPTVGEMKLYPLSYGFGMDTVANAFKVVLIIHFHPPGRTPVAPDCRYSSPEFPSKVLVYTLGTPTWRELEDFVHEVKITKSFPECYRYLNGFFFWLCVSPAAALAFDLGNDVFRVINDPLVVVPDVLGNVIPPHHKRLAIYKDSLALFITKWWNEGTDDMWLLNKEEWCWVKYLSIGSFIPRGMGRYMVVGCMGDDGKLILRRNDDQFHYNGHLEDAIVLFDPTTEVTKQCFNSYPGAVFVYKDSLVSVGGTIFPVSRSINPRGFDTVDRENGDGFMHGLMDWRDFDYDELEFRF